ncbi:MAG: PPOX class F420-dependent oxidoreductase [Dehalococcoidia bacterium]
MIPDSIRKFLEANHKAVLSTFRANGSAQLSVVLCGLYRDGVGISTTTERAKYANLHRDPRCSLLVSKDDWWGYVVLEGRAELLSPGDTDPEELRLALRDVYRSASGQEHPDWDEYDQAMVEEKRAVVIVTPERIYGTAV